MPKVTSSDIKRYGEDEMAKRIGGPSTLEERLWSLASMSPYGGKVIEAIAARDPYLLRTYMTPTRDEIREFCVDALGVRSSTLLSLLSATRCYLHYFFRGDEDREVHNHPFERSVSLILTGGYREHRWVPQHQRFDVKDKLPGNFNYIRRNDFHRVTLFDNQGCWTLFTTIGRAMPSNGQDWHFLDTTTGEMIPWGQWDSRKASPVWRAVGANRNDHT